MKSLESHLPEGEGELMDLVSLAYGLFGMVLDSLFTLYVIKIFNPEEFKKLINFRKRIKR